MERIEVRWQSGEHEWSAIRDGDDAEIARGGVALRLGADEVGALLRGLRRIVSSAAAYRRWTPEDDEALGRAYDAGETVYALAERFSRSRGAIEARLVGLGKLADDGRRRWRR